MIEEQMNEMAEAFLRWPLPDDVCADDCACKAGAPNRTGTNLLTAHQALAMIRFVCRPELTAMYADVERLSAELAALRAERDAWQPIETAPHMRKIIVHYLNDHGRRRVVMACYYEEKALEMHDDYEEVGVWDEASETCFAPAGWYEEHDSDDPILTLGGEPTHWMPLPAPPVIDAAIARGKE